MIRKFGLPGAIVATLVVVACADDDPTGVGVGLVPGADLRTFEVELDGERVFASGESFSGYQEPWQSAQVIAANDAGGELNVRALARFGDLPGTVSWEDDDGLHHDSDPTFVSGELLVPVDTAVMSQLEPVALDLLPVLEAWHDQSASWTTRVDSGDVSLPWSEPGGTTGEPVATVNWATGVDTLRFSVDSQTVAAWTETEEDARGAMVAVASAGQRFFGGEMVLRLNVRPSTAPDTIVNTDLSPTDNTFIFDPAPGEPDALRVGGTPGWRAFLTFRDRLDTVTVTGPDGEGTYRLDQLSINSAAISLLPVAPPAGFEPEDTIRVGIRVANTSDEIPLARSPIGRQLTRSPTGVPIPWERFTGTEAERVDVDMSQFQLVNDLIATPGAGVVPRTVAILPRFLRFGIGTFGAPGDGDAAPRLRLIVTVTGEDAVQ